MDIPGRIHGIGPATVVDDGPRGFGAHSDQERILEAELQRFVRFNLDVVKRCAAMTVARLPRCCARGRR